MITVKTLNALDHGKGKNQREKKAKNAKKKTKSKSQNANKKRANAGCVLIYPHANFCLSNMAAFTYS